MTKRSVYLALAAGLLAWSLGAMEARAGSVPLSSLLGTSVSFDGLTFDFQSYTNSGTAPPATAVNVTFGIQPDGLPGFSLNGSFSSPPGSSGDGTLKYTVSGNDISDVGLSGNPTLVGGTGSATVTETVYDSHGNPLGSIGIGNFPPGPLTNSLTFASQSLIQVVKDIDTVGMTGTAALSDVNQSFSMGKIPEPTSMGLLGIGMAGFFAFRRFRKWTTVV